jgi:hypothetical protein
MIDLASDLLNQLVPLVAFGVCWWPCCGGIGTACLGIGGGCNACVTDGVANFPSYVDVRFDGWTSGFTRCTNCATELDGITFRLDYDSCTDNNCEQLALYFTSYPSSSTPFCENNIGNPTGTSLDVYLFIRWFKSGATWSRNLNVYVNISTFGGTFDRLVITSTSGGAWANFNFTESGLTALTRFDCAAWSDFVLTYGGSSFDLFATSAHYPPCINGTASLTGIP